MKRKIYRAHLGHTRLRSRLPHPAHLGHMRERRSNTRPYRDEGLEELWASTRFSENNTQRETPPVSLKMNSTSNRRGNTNKWSCGRVASNSFFLGPFIRCHYLVLDHVLLCRSRVTELLHVQ